MDTKELKPGTVENSPPSINNGIIREEFKIGEIFPGSNEDLTPYTDNYPANLLLSHKGLFVYMGNSLFREREIINIKPYILSDSHFFIWFTNGEESFLVHKTQVAPLPGTYLSLAEDKDK